MTKPHLIKYSILLLLVFILFSCQKEKTEPETEILSIKQKLLKTDGFDSLVVALERFNLLDQYEYVPHIVDGFPSTPNSSELLAPTNEAFRNLLSFMQLNSISEIPSETLFQLINYTRFINISDIIDMENISIGTFGNYTIRLTTIGGTKIWTSATDYANVLGAYGATNGNIYCIDKILVPTTPDIPPTKTFIELITENSDLDSLEVAINLTSFKGNFSAGTIFAPNNKAFVDLLNRFHLNKISDISRDSLQVILQYNTLLYPVSHNQFADGMKIPYNGSKMFNAQYPQGHIEIVKVHVNGSTITIDGVDKIEGNANIEILSTEDVWGTDGGVMHITNKVFLTEELKNFR